ncbi:P-loop containing nucleoside triphosphate hydrolase protein [Cyathus striatus]|nr:P-loop containing nucleoside triphosphate hydrolase protein [Cyathus striatus]
MQSDTSMQDSTPIKQPSIEVRLKSRAAARFDTIRGLVLSYLSSFERLVLPSVIEGWQDVPELAASVESVAACESVCTSASLTTEEMFFQVHVYQPSDSDSFEEDDDDGTMAACVFELPNRNWEGLWDSLIYSDNVKTKLLNYLNATLLLSDANVDFNLVSWNRVVLLHGPPGTGKTSLCRALAQKYSNTRLLEINSHSLFSKWFSESGKLVQRLFSSISDILDDEDGFLVVLIDEVESLTSARASSIAGNEPSDGLRVVNALLTQLDKMKYRKNVLILATSNLVKAIDSAFVDRADIIQYIDLPSREAIYTIIVTCLCEIMNKGLMPETVIPSLKQAQMYELILKTESVSSITAAEEMCKQKKLGLKLLALASQCKARCLSGRALRRLPVHALSRHIGVGTVQHTEYPGSAGGIEVDEWTDSMKTIVEEQIQQFDN